MSPAEYAGVPTVELDVENALAEAAPRAPSQQQQQPTSRIGTFARLTVIACALLSVLAMADYSVVSGVSGAVRESEASAYLEKAIKTYLRTSSLSANFQKTIKTYVRAAPPLSAADGTKEGDRVCLTHVSYGKKFEDIDAFTVPTKRAYAERWGYEAKVYIQDTFMELVTIDFKNCMGGGIQDPLAYDRQSLLKFCGVWAAFDDGCDTVLFTDGDAVVASPDIKVEYWLGLHPSADVYWSLNDPAQASASYCERMKAKMFTGEGDEDLNLFGTCLNSGTFIMRNTFWTRNYLERLLRLSSNSIERKCSTKSLNPHHFDQCDFRYMGREVTPGQAVTQSKVGDQCVIACDAMNNEDDLKHFASFGAHHYPVFQFVQTNPSLLYQILHYKPWKQDKAYVVNCAGHAVKDQKLDCVRMHAKEATPMDRHSEVLQWK